MTMSEMHGRLVGIKGDGPVYITSRVLVERSNLDRVLTLLLEILVCRAGLGYHDVMRTFFTQYLGRPLQENVSPIIRLSE